MSDIEEVLLPCPFCGGKPYLVKDHLGGVIRCGNCEARMVITDNGRGEGLDISGWNKRAIIKHGNTEPVAWLCSYGKGLNTYLVDNLDKMDIGHEAQPLYLHHPKEQS